MTNEDIEEYNSIQYNCRGSWDLGSQCGECDKCKETKPMFDLKTKFKTGDYICVAKWEHKSKLWYQQKMENPFLNGHLDGASHIELIHERHMNALNEHLSIHDNFYITLNGSIVTDFIDTYREESDYILWPKPLYKEKLNNFEEYGFTGNFEGEILKVINDKYIGYVRLDDEVFTFWDKNGFCYEVGSTHTHKWHKHKLTLIKKEWHENTDNFPCLCYVDGDKQKIQLILEKDSLGLIARNPVDTDVIRFDESRITPLTNEEIENLKHI